MGRKSSISIEGTGRRWLKDAGVFRYYVNDPDGRPISKRFGKDEDAAAMEWVRKTLARFDAGEKAGKALVAVIMEDVLRGMAARHPTHATHARHVYNGLVRAGITDVKAEDFGRRVQAWIDGLKHGWWHDGTYKFKREAKPLAAGGKHAVYRKVAILVNHARADRRFGIHWDPLHKVDVPPATGEPKPTFSVDDLRKLVSDERRKDKWWLPNCLGVYTGWRAQEFMHVRWEWVDFKADTIALGIEEDYENKTGVSRLAALQPELKDVLLSVMRERGLTPETAKGHIIDCPYMRHSGAREETDADLTSKNAYGHAFQKMLKRFDVIALEPGRKKRRSTHSLRHTFVAIMFALRVPEERIKTWVGHAPGEITLKTYGRERERFYSAVKDWPADRLCLRHAPDSEFHKPKPPEAAPNPEVAKMMEELAKERAARARLEAKLDKLMDKMLDAEAFVLNPSETAESA